MNDAELSALKAAAAAKPDGPEALRLTWMKARAANAPRGRLLELITTCRQRNFSIPEIDAYVAEQLASAREGLEKARKSGVLAPEVLTALERAINQGEFAEQDRRELAKTMSDPEVVRALEIASAFAKGDSDLG